MADGTALQQIDASIIGVHAKLLSTDDVYFWREYTSDRNYSFSKTNQLMTNLKKKPTSSPNELYYKGQAVDQCARFFSASLSSEWLDQGTLVPVPCSKAKGDPEYDDRMTRVCRAIRPQKPPDVRELVIQTKTLMASHKAAKEGKPRTTVAELIAAYKIDETLAEPTPAAIAIVDDLLTVGRHYRAMHMVLSNRFPGVPIVGLFVARRIFADIANAAADNV